jgi:hypothetical protein
LQEPQFVALLSVSPHGDGAPSFVDGVPESSGPPLLDDDDEADDDDDEVEASGIAPLPPEDDPVTEKPHAAPPSTIPKIETRAVVCLRVIYGCRGAL